MASSPRYDPRLTTCPACGAGDLVDAALKSTAGFMSLPDVEHSLCPSCGTYCVNPQPTDAVLDAFYRDRATEAFVEDRILAQSVARYFDPRAREYFIEHRVRPLERYLAPGHALLDVGCGAGVFVRVMRDRGYRPTGIDLSERSVEAGRKALGLERELTIGHWCDVGAGAYHAVTAWTLIEHLKDPAAFLRKAAALITPGGVVLVEYPTVDSLLFRHLGASFFWVMPFYHMVLFSRRGMHALLGRSGFEVVEEHSMPRNWYFVASVCRSLGLDVDELTKDDRWGGVARRLDEIFDDIALEQGASSTVYVIARRA